ncbi:MAG: DIP1984 family protein [Oscillospiraceae bacterium]|nr:DIP1984 family protein [Oscillospiraceae bacterium]
MKLAEALQERADLNRRIADLRSRLASNATVQEGEKPAEEPAELLAELDRCTAALAERITRINLANCRTVVDGRTLTELLADRDCLTLQIGAYRQLLDNASQTAYRARGTEIKVLSTVNVAELQKQVDAMSHRLRLLDNTIQQTNWTTDL